MAFVKSLFKSLAKIGLAVCLSAWVVQANCPPLDGAPSVRFKPWIQKPPVTKGFASPAQYLHSTLEEVRTRKYDAVSNLIEDDFLQVLQKLSKESPPQQMEKIYVHLISWKIDLQNQISALDRKRAPEVPAGTPVFSGAVSDHADLDGLRNDLILASSEITSLWEDLVIEFLPLFHSLTQELQRELTIAHRVPIVLLSTEANHNLDHWVSFNGHEGTLSSSQIEIDSSGNGTLWLQDDGTSSKKSDPLYFRLSRIIEREGLWLWVFHPLLN